MFGWVGGPFLSKVEPDAKAYDKRVTTTRQTEEKAMQRSWIDKTRNAEDKKNKKTNEKDKNRKDNNEENVVNKTIGKVTWRLAIKQMFCDSIFWHQQLSLPKHVSQLYLSTSCCFSRHAKIYVIDKEKINSTQVLQQIKIKESIQKKVKLIKIRT